MGKVTANKILSAACGGEDSFAYCVSGAYKVVAWVKGADLLQDMWGNQLAEIVEDSGGGYDYALALLANTMLHQSARATGCHGRELDVLDARTQMQEAGKLIRAGVIAWCKKNGQPVPSFLPRER
jgi:hypothetical protein